MSQFAPREFSITLEHDAAMVMADLSAARCVGQHLWLGCDEGTRLERLTLTSEGTAEHTVFAIRDYLPLPNDDDEEVDVEGLAYSDYYLWVLGSHSLKRKKPNKDTLEENLERLATLEREDNRYLLGRIPLVNGQLFRQCSHPDDPDRLLTAARIKRKKKGSHLTAILADDPHLGLYLDTPLPGKENGFDLEGIAVLGDRVFVGCRGPVLRGWAVLLELFLREADPGVLKLDKSRGYYRKHFCDLRGHGIRDLCMIGDDLLLLAGPTMDLDGLARVYRLPSLCDRLEDSLFTPEPVLDLLDKYHSEKAEGITLMSNSSDQLLVVYDSPAPERISDTSVRADLFPLAAVATDPDPESLSSEA